MNKTILASVGAVFIVVAVLAAMSLRKDDRKAAGQPQTAAQSNTTAANEGALALERIVASDNASSTAMLETIYTGRITGGEINAECDQQVQKRAERIGQASTLTTEPRVRDSFVKLMESENRLARAVRTFEYGKLELSTNEDLLNSSVRLQNYQQVSKWQGKVDEAKQQTAADGNALRAAVDEVVALEQDFRAVAPATLKFDAVYSKWQDKMKQDLERN